MDPLSNGEFFELSETDSDESDSLPARTRGLKNKIVLSISTPPDERIVILSD
jgi:hypothetical protein